MNLVVDALAAFRLTRLVVVDAFPPIRRAREWLLTRWPSADTDFTEVTEGANRAGVEVVKVDGRYWAVRPHWLGELVTCPWCAGFWVAAGVVAARSWLGFWPILGTVLAISAVVGLLARIE